jgi:1-deoxyxylulose-5-phosphate synthase
VNSIDRRAFIRQALAGAGALTMLHSPFADAAKTAVKVSFSAADRVSLGRTGIIASRLAIGSGTHGVEKASNQTRMGLPKFLEFVSHARERGVNFWDMADQYGSHPFFAAALKEVPRSEVVILTKSTTRDAAGMEKDIERFLKELGTDHLDILLLHCLTDPAWTGKMHDTMEVLSQAKQKGTVRAFGVSCHDLGALKAAVESPWTEVILARLNHAGVAMDAEPTVVSPLLKKAHESGKAVIAMKITGAGKLRDQIDQSLRYVLGRGFVDTFTMGFESTLELDQVFDKVAAVRA